MKKIYICTDSVTGIFSAIYDAWKAGCQEGDCGIILRGNVEQELFCEYLETEEKESKTAAVERMIVKHLGMQAYWNIYHALLSNSSEKGDVILGTMMAARKISDSTKIMNHLSHPMVERVFELSRNVGGEAHAWKGFLRFTELENGILFALITPKNRILTCIAPHFADRLPRENWMIYDKTYGEIVLHEVGKRWILTDAGGLELDKVQNMSEKEQKIAGLWKMFVGTVEIEERRNLRCQRQHLPLWYRENMTEFVEKN